MPAMDPITARTLNRGTETDRKAAAAASCVALNSKTQGDPAAAPADHVAAIAKNLSLAVKQQAKKNVERDLAFLGVIHAGATSAKDLFERIISLATYNADSTVDTLTRKLNQDELKAKVAQFKNINKNTVMNAGEPVTTGSGKAVWFDKTSKDPVEMILGETKARITNTDRFSAYKVLVDGLSTETFAGQMHKVVLDTPNSKLDDFKVMTAKSDNNILKITSGGKNITKIEQLQALNAESVIDIDDGTNGITLTIKDPSYGKKFEGMKDPATAIKQLIEDSKAKSLNMTNAAPLAITGEEGNAGSPEEVKAEIFKVEDIAKLRCTAENFAITTEPYALKASGNAPVKFGNLELDIQAILNDVTGGAAVNTFSGAAQELTINGQASGIKFDPAGLSAAFKGYDINTPAGLTDAQNALRGGLIENVNKQIEKLKAMMPSGMNVTKKGSGLDFSGTKALIGIAQFSKELTGIVNKDSLFIGNDRYIVNINGNKISESNVTEGAAKSLYLNGTGNAAMNIDLISEKDGSKLSYKVPEGKLWKDSAPLDGFEAAKDISTKIIQKIEDHINGGTLDEILTGSPADVSAFAKADPVKVGEAAGVYHIADIRAEAKEVGPGEIVLMLKDASGRTMRFEADYKTGAENKWKFESKSRASGVSFEITPPEASDKREEKLVETNAKILTDKLRKHFKLDGRESGGFSSIVSVKGFTTDPFGNIRTDTLQSVDYDQQIIAFKSDYNAAKSETTFTISDGKNIYKKAVDVNAGLRSVRIDGTDIDIKLEAFDLKSSVPQMLYQFGGKALNCVFQDSDNHASQSTVDVDPLTERSLGLDCIDISDVERSRESMKNLLEVQRYLLNSVGAIDAAIGALRLSAAQNDTIIEATLEVVKTIDGLNPLEQAQEMSKLSQEQQNVMTIMSRKIQQEQRAQQTFSQLLQSA
jgi:hypothetical protein